MTILHLFRGKVKSSIDTLPASQSHIVPLMYKKQLLHLFSFDLHFYGRLKSNLSQQNTSLMYFHIVVVFLEHEYFLLELNDFVHFIRPSVHTVNV